MSTQKESIEEIKLRGKQRAREVKIISNLVGKKITSARWLTQEEATNFGLTKIPFVIFFGDDGHYMIPICDDEMNDGGSIFCNWGEGVIWTK
tara:strand:+ start:122 stop:397 length:276 start_codon:yes stop_codon:yes gene_type:complete